MRDSSLSQLLVHSLRTLVVQIKSHIGSCLPFVHRLRPEASSLLRVLVSAREDERHRDGDAHRGESTDKVKLKKKKKKRKGEGKEREEKREKRGETSLRRHRRAFVRARSR